MPGGRYSGCLANHHVPLTPMKTPVFLITLCAATTLLAADLPTGQKTPEGVACDAIMAYAHADSKAWLATFVRPIYGEERNKEYEEFKKEMAANTDKNKNDKAFKPPRIVKCYKAREFTMNGPGSMAYAVDLFTGNMFVDMVVETAPGETQGVRYHVMKDKDGKWYFEPRPDLCPLFSMGLNDEKKSKDLLYEADQRKAEPEKGTKQPGTKTTGSDPKSSSRTP